MSEIEKSAIGEDRLLGGRVRLRQPPDGYRAAIDPVLLAAAVPARGRERVLDLGCGGGAASLALAARLADLRITGIDRDLGAVALFQENIDLNDWGDRLDAFVADVAAMPERCAGSFDHVMLNPPYLSAEAGDRSPYPGRARANVEGDAGLGTWLAAALDALGHKGWVTLIHRADRVDEAIGHLAGRAGAVTIIPLWPKAGIAAKRVVVRARKGVRSPATIDPGLVLHEADGRYTAAAEAVLRDAAALAPM